jgi:hypothetical protein
MINNLRKRYEQLQGLLNTPMNQGGGLLGNIPQGALLGSAIFGQGIQGKDPFSALLPAVAQTSQIQSQFLQMEEMKRKMEENVKARKQAEKQRNYFESLPSDHPFKELAKAFPNTAATAVVNLELKKIDDTYTKQQDKKKAIADYTKNVQDQENKLFSSYQSNKVVQDFDQATQGVTKLLQGLEADDGAGDVAAIFTFMKTLDPSSVVREGEFATAENSSGAFRKFWNLHNKLLRGERLTDPQRESFKQVGINLYQQNEKALDNVRSNFSQIAANQGLNIDNIFVDSDIRPKFESVVEMAAPGTKQTTKTQRVPPNAVLVDYEDGKYYFKVPGRRDYLVTDGYK